MANTAINPAGLFQSRQYGFSQAVSASGRRTIYFSGQVGWDEHEQVVGQGDLRAQTIQSLKNLQVCLQAAGAALPDVVSLRIYIRQDVIDQGSHIKDALLQFFPGDSPPAATWIGVPSLADPDFLVEIEAVAVIDE